MTAPAPVVTDSTQADRAPGQRADIRKESGMTDPTDRASDDFGCPAVADVRLKGGLTLLTRCRRRSGHPGQHNDKKVRRWLDSETVWLVRPTSGALENVTSTGDDE